MNGTAGGSPLLVVGNDDASLMGTNSKTSSMASIHVSIEPHHYDQIIMEKDGDDNVPPAAEKEDRSMIFMSAQIMSDVHDGDGGGGGGGEGEVEGIATVPQLQVMVHQLQKEVDRARSNDRNAMACMQDLRADLEKVIHENEDLVKDVTNLIGTCERTQQEKLQFKQTLKETQVKQEQQQRQQQKQQQEDQQQQDIIKLQLQAATMLDRERLQHAKERGFWKQEKANLQHHQQQDSSSSCCKNCTKLQLKHARERGLWQQENDSLQELLTLSENRVKRLEFLLKTPSHRIGNINANVNAANNPANSSHRSTWSKSTGINLYARTTTTSTTASTHSNEENQHPTTNISKEAPPVGSPAQAHTQSQLKVQGMDRDPEQILFSKPAMMMYMGKQGTCGSTAQSSITQSFQASSLPFPRSPANVPTICLFPDRVEDDEHECVASVVLLPPLEPSTHFDPDPDAAGAEEPVEMHRPRSNATKHKHQSTMNKHQQQTRLKSSASGPALSSSRSDSSSGGGGGVGTTRSTSTSTSRCGSTSMACSNNNVNMSNNAPFEGPLNINGNKKMVDGGTGTVSTRNTSRCRKTDLRRSSASRFRENKQEQDGNDTDNHEEPYDGAPNRNAITCTDKQKTERTSRRRNNVAIRPEHYQHHENDAVGRHGITDCEQDSRSPSATMKKSVSGPALSRQEHDQACLVERNGRGKGNVSLSSSTSSHDIRSKSGNAAGTAGSRHDHHRHNNKKRTTSMFSLRGAFSSTGMLQKASPSSHATFMGYKNAMLARKHKPSPTLDLFERHQNREEEEADGRPSLDAPSANTHTNMSTNAHANARASAFDKLVQEAQQSLFGVSVSPVARGAR
jgi:hypothetical protein